SCRPSPTPCSQPTLRCPRPTRRPARRPVKSSPQSSSPRPTASKETSAAACFHPTPPGPTKPTPHRNPKKKNKPGAGGNAEPSKNLSSLCACENLPKYNGISNIQVEN